MNEHVKSRLNELPTSPGVYFHKNQAGEVIYVGKAARLSNRVRQYFQKSRLRDPKTDALVADIRDIDWIETESEIDALFLEAEMIKRYMPKYNIMLRDDKSDLWVRIDMKSDHPTVTYTRRPLDDGADYYGPFTYAMSVRRAMKYLRRIFPYDDKKPVAKNRVTLNYHIGISPGLEEGKTSLEDYRKNLRSLSMYLKGERSRLVKSMEIEMKQAAKDKDFERAALLRNQGTALKHLNQQIIFGDQEFMDISKDKGLSGLMDLLKLEKPPRRIEGYDISHMSGTNNVASMVVFTNGIPDKREYRKFKMRLPGNNDFGHMAEVMTRRFSDKNTTKWKAPDLLLIDGGKGQLGAALEAMRAAGHNVPAIGLAKRFETIIVKKDDGEFEEVLLGLNSDVTKLLQRIRDEAHRFAVSYHSSLKVKGQTESVLEEIPTIGAETRKKLIKTFGSLKGVQQARQMELEKAVGVKKAALIKQYLRPLKKDQYNS